MKQKLESLKIDLATARKRKLDADKARQDAKQDGKPNPGKPEAPLGVDPNGP